MDSAYRYERHLTSGDEIRLLELDPGFGSSLLKGSIHYRHLSKKPRYEALSYTWGNPFSEGHPFRADRHNLCINDESIEISENLHSALLHLRQPAKAVTFWIDAICIDQSHNEEKAWQVQMIRDIYWRASRVVIWLGPADATSDLAMYVLQAGYRYFLRTEQYTRFGEVVADVPKSKDGQEYEDELVAYALGVLFGVRSKPDFPIPDYPIEAVATLLSRAYYGRGWCWQEFVLAKKLSLVCGDRVLEEADMCLQLFLQTWDMLQKESGKQAHGLDHRSWSMMELRRSYSNIAFLQKIGFKDNPDIEGPPEWFHRGVMKIWAYQNPKMTDKGKAGVYREAKSRLSMKELLQEANTAWLETSRKEDQIYALSGMASDAKRLGIKVDYTIPWEKLYTQLAVAYLTRNDLWFLRYCQGTLSGRSSSLPSWVPDWSQGYRGTHVSHHYDPPPEHLGCLEPDSRPDLHEVGSNGRLKLRGILVDEVAWVSSQRFLMSVNDLATLSDRWNLYRWISEVTSKCHPQSHRTIWTVMIANAKNLPLPPQYHEEGTDEERRVLLDHAFSTILTIARNVAYSSLLGLIEVEDGQLKLVIECYLRCFMQATNFKCIFQTRLGRLGLAHIGIRQGDRVAVFMGTDSPFIIRSCTLNASEGARYNVLGESYVHGVMEDEKLIASAVVEDIVLE